MERDYGVWKFSGKEKAKLILSYLGLCGLVSWLFYHSFWAVLPFLAGLPVFLKKSREKRIKERREELLTEFLTGIRAIASALNAGYSMENALGEALKETEKVYGMDGVFTEELREMERKRNLNQSMETLWADLGKRSGLEDIENFGEIFQVARRSGGNLKEIIQSTADNITRKTETRREIEISLAAKKMEQKVMSAVPFFILAYVDLGSPEFLEGLYHNKLGGGVSDVADTQVSMKGMKGFFFKNFVDESQIFMGAHVAFRPRGIADGNTTGFLAAVLQGTQAIVNRRSGFGTFFCKDTENAAFLFDFTGRIQFHVSIPRFPVSLLL